MITRHHRSLYVVGRIFIAFLWHFSNHIEITISGHQLILTTSNARSNKISLQLEPNKLFYVHLNVSLFDLNLTDNHVLDHSILANDTSIDYGKQNKRTDNSRRQNNETKATNIKFLASLLSEPDLGPDLFLIDGSNDSAWLYGTLRDDYDNPTIIEIVAIGHDPTWELPARCELVLEMPRVNKNENNKSRSDYYDHQIELEFYRTMDLDTLFNLNIIKSIDQLFSNNLWPQSRLVSIDEIKLTKRGSNKTLSLSRGQSTMRDNVRNRNERIIIKVNNTQAISDSHKMERLREELSRLHERPICSVPNNHQPGIVTLSIEHYFRHLSLYPDWCLTRIL